MPPVDRLVVQRLAQPGLLAHRVDGHPVIDPARGVAGEHLVGEGLEQEAVVTHRPEDQGSGLVDPLEHLALGQPPDQRVCERLRVEGVDRLPDRFERDRPVDPFVEHVIQDVVTGLGQLEGLAQQVFEVDDVDAQLAQGADEPIVLLLGPLDPQDLVKEQIVACWSGSAA